MNGWGEGGWREKGVEILFATTTTITMIMAEVTARVTEYVVVFE